MALASAITSNSITVSDIDAPAPISIVGGSYSINSGAYTTVDGTVNLGDTVTVRHTASGSFFTQMDTVLSIGGVSDTFTSTTVIGFNFATITDGLGSGSTVGSSGDATYADGTVITLAATAAPGSVFTGWIPTGCVDGFNLTADTVCTATFALCPSGNVAYVDQAAAGNSDGTDWSNAFTTLQDALSLFNSGACATITEIHVAAGTYYPDEGGGQTDDDRNATFQLKNNLAIYGGYPSGGGTRDWVANVTVLSGNIDQDGTNTNNNSYHVTTGSGTASTAVLDGFTISGGNANGGGSNGQGGGLYSDAGSATLRNLKVSGNTATGFVGGGGIHQNGGSLALNRVTLSGNSNSASFGGGMVNWGGTLTLQDSLVDGNTSANSGAGLISFNGSTTVIRTTLSNNIAAGGSGCIYNFGTLTVQDSICRDNVANGGGAGGIYNQGGALNIINTVLSGNSSSNNGGGIQIAAGTVTISDSTLSDNRGGGSGATGIGGIEVAGGVLNLHNSLIANSASGNSDCGVSGTGTVHAQNSLIESGLGCVNGTNLNNLSDDPALNPDFTLSSVSPAIDAGDNSLVPGGVTTDLNGNPRFYDVLAVADSGSGTVPLVDIGAYEAQYLSLSFTTPVNGTITDGGTLNCGTGGTACTAAYASGGGVLLAATGDAHYSLGTWGGDCATNSFTIAADMHCTATFSLNSYSVTLSAGAGGTLAPNAVQTVVHGASAHFTVSPSTGYSLAGISGCGGSLAGNIYTTGPITAACGVSAAFSLNRYSVIPSAGAGGTLDPSTAQTVNHGATAGFTVAPDTGYSLVGVTGCGGSLSGDTYTTGAITAACSVSATFNPNSYTLGVNSDGTGSGTVGGGGTFNYDTRVSPTATADSGSTFSGWTPASCGVEFNLTADTVCVATFTAAPSGTPGISGVTPSLGGVSEVAPGVVSASVNEDVGSVSVTLNRGAGSFGVIVLGYRSVDGSADAGSDYLPVSGTLTWADGDSSDREIRITILDDGEYESSESLQLQLNVVSGDFSLGHTRLELNIADNDTQAVACVPNSGAFNLGTGNAVASAACFGNQVSSTLGRSGNGLMILQNEVVNLGLEIVTDPAHHGQSAQVLLLVSYQHVGHTTWLARAGSIWRFWREGESLPSAQDLAALPETLDVPVYGGTLSGLPGVFTVYAGYLLNDGTLVHNLPQPLRLTVANALVYNPANADQSSAYAYFNGETGDLYGYGNPHSSAVNQVLTSYTSIHTPALLASQNGGSTRQEVRPGDFVEVPAGYSAEVYVLRVFSAPGRLEYISRHNEQGWVEWSPETGLLLSAAQMPLGWARNLTLYHGVLPSAGEYTGYVGYRLPDGRVVYNGLELLRVRVE